MSRLKLHVPDPQDHDDNPMRFPTQWFEDDTSQQSLSIAGQLLELADDDRDLLGKIASLQDEALAIQSTLNHVLHLASNDAPDDPPAAA